MGEEKNLSDYNLNSKIPVIVMITKSPEIKTESPKPEETSDKIDLESANFKRTRTVTEDSGIEEDFNCDHFNLNHNKKEAILGKDEILENIENYCEEMET